MKARWRLLSFFFLFAAQPLFATPDFLKQSGIVLSTVTPQVVDTSTSPYRLYFLRNEFEIRSATSADGVSWFEEPGIRLSTATTPLVTVASVTGCGLLPITAGGYRMLYTVRSDTTSWNIVIATSSDGLAWANTSEIAFSFSSATFIGSPRLLKMTNGDWRLYFLKDINGGSDAADKQVHTALSTDEGVTWSTSALILAQQAGDISVATRTDSRVRLYMTQPLTGETTNSVVVSALSDSSAGSTFVMESGNRISTTSIAGQISSIAVFRSTDTFRFRLLYGFSPHTSTHTFAYAAFTSSPDVQSLSPSSIIRTDPNATLTVLGEIFGSTPTVRLTRSGEADVTGTSIVRNSDQSLTVTFATNGLGVGRWNVIVTNPDGVEGTLSNALNIDFASGVVGLLDNLLRPRNGNVTSINVTIFNAGQVTLDLYTLDGKLVNTLFNGDLPLGLSTFTWDGKTGGGNTVASGVYLLRVHGPKLDEIKKIVVIR